MKFLQIIFYCIVLLLATVACEKADLSEEKDGKAETEVSGGNSQNGTGDGQNGSNGESDGSSSSSDNEDEWQEDDTDRNSYEEKDIVDGNTEQTGEYHTGDTVTVTQFLRDDINCQIWVKGYIVGTCTKKIENAKFEPPFTDKTAILLASSPNETNTNKVVSIELKSGSKLRDKYNLADHPERKGTLAAFFGIQGTYLGVLGIKGATGSWPD